MKKVVHACQIRPQKQQPTTTNKCNIIFLSDSKVWITMIKYIEIPKLKKKILWVQQTIIRRARDTFLLLHCPEPATVKWNSNTYIIDIPTAKSSKGQQS